MRRSLPIPVIDGMVRVPARLIGGRGDVLELKRKLTAEHYDPETKITTKVPIYQDIPGGLALPRYYVRKRMPDVWKRAVRRTTPVGVGKGNWPCNIKPRDDDQAEFFRQVGELVLSDNVTDAQIEAQTGTGKTVVALGTCANNNIGPVLILVNKNRLKETWLGNVKLEKGLRFFFGEEWVDKNVGIVQQDVCDFRGKTIVIGMMPSIARRKYPADFYRQFGLIIIDEVHNAATPEGTKVLGMFNAQVRIGMSATLKTGSMAKVTNTHLGPAAITSSQESMKPTVVRVVNKARMDNIRDWNTGEIVDTARSILNPLTKSAARNELLADLIYYRGYLNGRQVLGLSDRTDQVVRVRDLLIERGVPAERIGIYVGSHRTNKFKARAELREGLSEGLCKRLTRSPVFETDKEAKAFAKTWTQREDIQDAWAELEGIGAQPYYVTEAAKYIHKPSKEEYQWIEDEAQIVLATYGIFKEGIDVSRLDWGIELSPRKDVTQAVGRVLRIKKGKKTPAWYTIVDHIVTLVKREMFGRVEESVYRYKTPIELATGRLSSYNKQNATLKRMDNAREALTHQKHQASNRGTGSRKATVGRKVRLRKAA